MFLVFVIIFALASRAMSQSLIKLSGTVKSADGTIFPGYTVTYTKNNVATSVVTDANGRYSFTGGVTSGSFNLAVSCAYPNGYGTVPSIQLPCYFQLSSDLTMAADANNVDIAVPEFSLISASVVDSTGAPKPGFYVNPGGGEFTVPATKAYIQTSAAVTSSTNSALIVDWWNGNSAENCYFVRTDDHGIALFPLFDTTRSFSFTAQSVLGLASQAAKGPTIPAVDEDALITISLPPVISIYGKISDQQDKSFDRTNIQWRNNLGGYAYVMTDNEGSFSVTDVSAGSMTMMVAFNDMCLWIKQLEFSVSETINDFQIALPNRTYMEVTVFNADGTPSKGAIVYAEYHSGSYSYCGVVKAEGALINEETNCLSGVGGIHIPSSGCSASYRTTDSDGKATLEFLQAPGYQVTVLAAHPTSSKVYKLTGVYDIGEDHTGLSFTFPETKTVTGYITAANLAPHPLAVAGFYVSFSGVNQVQTDATGHFTFPAITTGYYDVQVQGSSGPNGVYSDIRGFYNLTADSEGPIQLVLPPLGTYNIFVTDYLGETITTGRVGSTGYYWYPMTSGSVFSGTENLYNIPSATAGFATDSNGIAPINFFYTEGTSDTVQVICTDALNTARVAMVSVPLSSSDQVFNCVLPSHPSPPQNLVVVTQDASSSPDATDSTATVSWEPPATDGGLPLVSYDIQVTLDVDSTSLVTTRRLLSAPAPITVDPSTRSLSIDGLESGASYNIKITASNQLGASKSTIAKVQLAPQVVSTYAPSSSPSSSRPSSSRPSSSAPSARATASPTVKPSAAITAKPSAASTARPSAASTIKPTVALTKPEKPTVKPSAAVTAKPTVKPSAASTVRPSAAATAKPTVKPSAASTVRPSATATAKPTVKPSAASTVQPSAMATAKPTVKPSAAPTAKPSVAYTVNPTKKLYRLFSPELEDATADTTVKATDASNTVTRRNLRGSASDSS